jgi:hypothetical protein
MSGFEGSDCTVSVLAGDGRKKFSLKPATK